MKDKHTENTQLPLHLLESGLYPPPNNPKAYCRRSAKGLLEWVELFVWVIAIALLVFSFLLRIAVVDGISMESTLSNGDTLLIQSLAYTPQVGDVIVFQISTAKQNHPVVKRIIATEGDIVDIDFDAWEVYVNGERLSEEYIKKSEGVPMSRGNVTFPLTVPQGCVFVLGDNRNESLDSRYSAVGCVDTRAILGKVFLRILSGKPT